MGLSGSLRTLSLAEILQTLNRSQATGTLRLSSPIGGRDVIFDGGEIIQIFHRNDVFEHSLLERLVAMGHVHGDYLNEVPGTGSGGYSAITALVQGGQLDQQVLKGAEQELVQDEIFELFTWTTGNFLFREAGESDPEAQRLVDEAREHAVPTNMGMLLMEAARRVDEWKEIADFIPSDHDIPVIIDGHQEAFFQACAEYPAKPVAAAINGFNSFEDLYQRVPVSRMDIQFAIADLMEAGLLRVLSVDEMVARGEQMLGEGRPDLAAPLFRRALALEPSHGDAMHLLANSLEGAGNSPDAAGCYSQLAVTYVNERQPEQAVEMARRAYALQPTIAQALIVVRCLMEAGKTGDAIDQLTNIVQRQVDEGLLDEARSTCLKILGLQPESDEIRRTLAKIYQASGSAGGDEDLVVCVECGETNPRDAEDCESCGAPLSLTCLSCGRAIAASDSICIFCGADPNEAPGSGLSTEAPDTDIILSTAGNRPEEAAGQTDVWYGELRQEIRRARALEEEERFIEALDLWKVIARDQVDNRDLDRHVRELEGLVHDHQIERFIEAGHRFRDNRRFYMAGSSYKKALRCMSADDPRAERLYELIAVAKRGHQVSSVAYAIAFMCLALSGWMVVEPHFAKKDFIESIDRDIASVQAGMKTQSVSFFKSIVDIEQKNVMDARDKRIEDDSEVKNKLKELSGYTRFL